MAIIPGSIALLGPIAPTDTEDNYAIADSQYIKGGYQVVDQDLETITLARRTGGMLVYVKETAKEYRLEDDLETWTELLKTAEGYYLPLSGGSLTGQVYAIDPTTSYSIATKGYVDTNFDALAGQISARIAKSGDTMSGFLFLHANPTLGLHATTKSYADTQDALKVNKAGDTMGGFLMLNANPTLDLHAVTKSYTDTQNALKVNKAGDTMGGFLLLNANPTLGLHAVTKSYTDTQNDLKVNKAGDTMSGLLNLLGAVAQDPGVSSVQFRLLPTSGTRDIDTAMLEGEMRMVDGGLQLRARQRSAYYEPQPLITIFGATSNFATVTPVKAKLVLSLSMNESPNTGLLRCTEEFTQESSSAGTVNGVCRVWINTDHIGSFYAFRAGTIEGSTTMLSILHNRLRIGKGRHLHIQTDISTNASAGVATLVAGTVTITTTKAGIATPLIFVTGRNIGAGKSTWGSLNAFVASSTTITIESANNSDTRQVSWWIIENSNT